MPRGADSVFQACGVGGHPARGCQLHAEFKLQAKLNRTLQYPWGPRILVWVGGPELQSQMSEIRTMSGASQPVMQPI